MKLLRLTEKEFALILEAVEAGVHYHRENWAEGDLNEHDDNGNWIRQYHWKMDRLIKARLVLKGNRRQRQGNKETRG